MIIIKSQKEIEIMREAGKIVAETHEILRSAITPGISTLELDKIAEENIRKYNAIPSFKGYGGFPRTICASVNEEVVHGIPSNRILKEGGVLAFQLPTNIPWRFRFQPVRKIYSGLKFLGISDGFLYNQLGLYPMKMNFIPEDIMRGFLEKVGFRIVDVKSDTYCGPSVKSRTYYCVKNN